MQQIVRDIIEVVAKSELDRREREAAVCETCGRTGAEGCDEAMHMAEVEKAIEEIHAGTAKTEPFDAHKEMADIEATLMEDINSASVGGLIGMVLLELCENTTLYSDGHYLTCTGCNGMVPIAQWEAGTPVTHSPWCIVKTAELALTKVVDLAEAEADQRMGE